MSRLRDTGRDSAEDNKDKKGQKTMISLTRENGVTVRLDAAYDVEKETAEFVVNYDGNRFYFAEFSKAAVLYKSLCKELEMGCKMEERIATLNYLYGRKEVA